MAHCVHVFVSFDISFVGLRGESLRGLFLQEPRQSPDECLEQGGRVS